MGLARRGEPPVIGIQPEVPLLLLFLAASGCHLDPDDRPGVNFYVRNSTDISVDVTFTLQDPERSHRTLGVTEVHLAPNTMWTTARWDGDFDTFVVLAVAREPGGHVLAERKAPWPGEAGISDGAGSPRIAVELEVVPGDVVFRPLL